MKSRRMKTSPSCRSFDTARFSRRKIRTGYLTIKKNFNQLKLEKIISTEKEYEESLERLAQIFDSKPDISKAMESELLVNLIEKYEKEN